MADRLLEDDAKAIRAALCFERASTLLGKDDCTPPPRRMSDALATRHLSVLGSRPAMDAALNWYRAAFAGGSTLALSEVPPIEVPTLYIWGREDMSVGERAATLTPEYVKAECRFEAIDGAGHFLAEEVPDRVNELLLEHFASH